MAALDLPEGDPVFVGEFDLNALASFSSDVESRRVEPLPRFPSIVRDISIIVDEYLPAAKVRGTIRSAAPATLAGVREFDRYQGKGIPDGRTSLSLRLTFQSPERTLTDAEVQQAMEDILAALVKEHGAVQR
jgi:phenylalanyl-tRNA synthetase beta chain